MIPFDAAHINTVLVAMAWLHIAFGAITSVIGRAEIGLLITFVGLCIGATTI